MGDEGSFGGVWRGWVIVLIKGHEVGSIEKRYWQDERQDYGCALESYLMFCHFD